MSKQTSKTPYPKVQNIEGQLNHKISRQQVVHLNHKGAQPPQVNSEKFAEKRKRTHYDVRARVGAGETGGKVNYN